jgi:hypothetical protein
MIRITKKYDVSEISSVFRQNRFVGEGGRKSFLLCRAQ